MLPSRHTPTRTEGEHMANQHAGTGGLRDGSERSTALGMAAHLSVGVLVGVVLVAVRVASSAQLPSAQCQHKAIPLVSDQARARKHPLGSGPSLWHSQHVSSTCQGPTLTHTRRAATRRAPSRPRSGV